MALKVGDLLFIDTNVLLTATDESRPNHEAARRLIAQSGRYGLHLAVSGQILREYLVVATRPVDANGLGLDSHDAIGNLGAFLRYIRLYEETEATADRLRQLGLTHDLRGKRYHDANIVATMLVHGIHALVTENSRDFAPFVNVETVAMMDVTSGLRVIESKQPEPPIAP